MIPNPAGSARDRYRSGAVATASPAALVTMLFDRAMSAVDRAETLLDDPSAQAIADAHEELARAQDIVSELQLSLDHERGGEIATGLHGLYDFCLDRLLRANLAKDPAPLPEVRHVLTTLRQAWVEAVDGSQ